jgi:TatD DNase family protein
MAFYIDTHAHLSMLDGRGIPSVPRLKELRDRGFGGVLDIGTRADDLDGRMRTLEGFSAGGFLRFSAGIWPSAEAIGNKDRCMDSLRKSIDSAPAGSVVAIGECGLDRHWNNEASGVDLRKERELFEAQLELARSLDMPVIVHSREAAADTAEAIGAYTGLRGVVHCFSYGKEEAARFLDLGFHISFAGNCTYKNSKEVKEALRFVPPDRLLFETDCPYLAPMPYRGKTAEPGMVERIYQFAAELRNTPLHGLIEEIAENCGNLFGFPNRSVSTPP